jgi:hypothetical protein
MIESREYQLYKAIATYLRLQYPRVHYHFDQAGLNLSKAQRGQLKAIQHSKGFPDLTIINPAGGILFLELKAEDSSPFKKNGELISDDHVAEQALWLAALQTSGYPAYFATGFDKARYYIDNFLNG